MLPAPNPLGNKDNIENLLFNISRNPSFILVATKKQALRFKELATAAKILVEFYIQLN